MIIEKIIGYCRRIEENLNRFDNSFDAFKSDHLFQDACCMCVVQIGELASQLSEEAKKLNPSIPWRIIKDTRNFYVHAYGSIDIPSVWNTLVSDIPELKIACCKLLK